MIKPFFALVLAIFCLPALASENPETGVLETVEKFFQGLNTNNPDLWREVIHDNAWFYAQRQNDAGGWDLSTYYSGERIDNLAANPVSLDERIYNPTVLVRGPIAVVWAPYDIYVDNEFSHCGIDVFNLVRVEGVWKITNLAYTTEPTACDALEVPPRR